MKTLKELKHCEFGQMCPVDDCDNIECAKKQLKECFDYIDKHTKCDVCGEEFPDTCSDCLLAEAYKKEDSTT